MLSLLEAGDGRGKMALANGAVYPIRTPITVIDGQ
jgi:hypothetical protein